MRFDDISYSSNVELERTNQKYTLIIGYDNLNDIKNSISNLLKKETIIYYDSFIELPSYDEVELMVGLFNGKPFSCLSENDIVNVVLRLFPDMSTKTNNSLSHLLYSMYIDLKALNINETLLKNSLVKVLKSLDSTFLKVLKQINSEDKDIRLFYYGDITKYGLLSFDILSQLGVNIICISKNGDIKGILLSHNYNKVSGSCYNFDFLGQLVKFAEYKSDIICNTWLSINKKDTVGNYLTSIFDNPINRIDRGKYRTVNIGFTGVLEENSYKIALNNFYLKNKDNSLLVENKFSNPNYEELETYTNLYSHYSSIENILNEFNVFKDTHIPKNIAIKLDELLDAQVDFSETKKMNYYKVLFLWIIRICNKFYKTIFSIQEMPLLILWGELDNKTKDLLRVLSELPLDIVHFTTNKQWETSGDVIYLDLGVSSVSISKFPTSIEDIKTIDTVTYKAEQQLNDILYNDNILFKYKQYKDINPVVLRTTYEEADILWNEPAKFRPSFNVLNDVVTIPTIFLKINGIKGNVDNYLESIKSKLVDDCLLYTESNCMSYIDYYSELYTYVKTVIYNNIVDFNVVMKSDFWRYKIYSTETQNLICNSIQTLLNSSWIKSKETKFVYKVLYILLSLSDDIVRLIHKYDFTSKIPKVIYFYSGNNICKEEDCIVMMFLRSLGFDILVYAPTGYMVIENMIDKSYYTSIELGEYRYDISELDLVNYQIKEKKTGFLSSLFKF